MSFFERLKGSKDLNKPESLKQETKSKAQKDWPEPEGQLAIDVYETKETIVIQSTIAGIKAEDLDISIGNDMVTIKGKREKPENDQEKKYFYQECYWGPFSRQVVLPKEVDTTQAKAVIKEGILTLTIPKLSKGQKRKITVIEEE